MKNLLKNLGFLKKLFSYGERIRPTRDWLVILLIGSILFLGGIGRHIMLFSDLVNGKVVGSAPLPPQSTVETSVSAAQTVFQKRAAEDSHYQNDYHFVDPSL